MDWQDWVALNALFGVMPVILCMAIYRTYKMVKAQND